MTTEDKTVDIRDLKMDEIDRIFGQFDEAVDISLDVFEKQVNRLLTLVWQQAATSFMVAKLPGSMYRDAADAMVDAAAWARKSVLDAYERLATERYDAAVEQQGELDYGEDA